MADFSVSLRVNVDVDNIQPQLDAATSNLKPIKLDVELGDIKGELKALNTELKSIGMSIGTIGSGGGMKTLLASVNQIGNALEKASLHFDNLTNKQNINSAAKATQQVARQTEKLISDSANRAINNVSSKGINRYFRVSSSDSNDFKREMDNLVRQWTNGKGNLVDLKIQTRTSWSEEEQKNIERLHQAHVTYQNAAGESVKKTIAWRKIGSRTRFDKDGNVMFDDDGNELREDVRGFVEVAADYRNSIKKTKNQTDNFVKQQKKAVSSFTNQINELDRNARDQAANRPIKEQGHLDALSNKYNEITAAIQRMGNASSSTFEDERNNVSRLISEYKSMKSEFKNAENVANKMKGVDFDSGKKIAEQDLAKFKADAKEYTQLAQTISTLDSAISNVGDSSSLNDFNNQLKVARAELAKVKSEASAANREKNLGINVSGLKSEIADLQKVNPAIDKFEAEIDGAKVSLQSLLGELGKVKTQGDFSVVNKKFAEFSKAAKNAGVITKDTVTQAEQISKIQNRLKDTGYDGFAEEAKRAKSEANSLKISTVEVEAAMKRLDNAMAGLNTANEEGDVKGLIAANKEYEAALKSLRSQIKLNQQAEKQNYDNEGLELSKARALLKLENLFESGSQAAKKYGAEMQNLQREIAECANMADMSHINDKIDILDKQVNRDGLQRQTFGSRIKAQFQKYSQYFSVAQAMMYAGQALRDMFQQVVAIDTAMTELKKVTDESSESYDNFLSNAASRAKELGTTVDGLVTSTADFARLGYDFEQSAGLAEVANIYTVVGDEIDGVETATQSLISTLAAFKHEMGDMSDSEFAMSIVDKFNEVSNNFAISSGGIGEALQRSASSLAAANNTVDESIALITAANTVVQNPEKVGNAFKTISMRIRGAKTELEEAGESTEGMAESTASLREEILALSGVDIMKNANEFKSTYAIMDELADKWEGLSDIAQASITELLAGKHQGNVMSSLMANFDIAREALETSQNSAGSAMAEHAKWSDSLEARLNKLKATWQSLSQSFLKSDFLKGGLNVITGFVDVLDKIIDKTGVIMPLLTAFAAKNIFNKIFNTAKMMQFAGGISSIGDVISVLTNSFPKLTGVIRTFMGAFSAAGGLSSISSLFSGITSGLGAVLSMINPVIGTIAILAATIGGIAYINHKQKKEVAELAEKVGNVTSEYREQHKELEKSKKDYDTSKEDSMIMKYKELSKGIDQYGENLSLTTDEYAEYSNIVNTIADQIPNLVTGYNSQGDAILSCAGNVTQLTEAYKNLIKEQNSEVTDIGSDIFKDYENDLKGTSAYHETYKSSAEGWSEEAIGHYDTEHFKQLEELMNTSDEGLEAAVSELTQAEVSRISSLLDEYGVKRDTLGSGEPGWENQREHIIRALGEDRKQVQGILSKASEDLNAYAEDMGTLTNAYLSTAFLGGDAASGINDYSGLSDEMQSIIGKVTSGLGTDFYSQFLGKENGYELFTQSIDSILASFKSLDSSKISDFETAFDLKTKFNGGEISFGEYVEGIQKASDIVGELGLDKEVENQIKLNLGFTKAKDDKGNDVWAIQEYETLLNRLTSRDFEIRLDTTTADSWIKDLTSTELSVTLGLVKENNADFNKALQNYRDVLNEAEQAGVDFSKTTYGNIDTKARQTIEWTSENLEKYKDALMSWESENASWDKVKKSYEGSISTVMGTLASYEINGKEVDIAFSPMLQTENGAEVLSSDTVDTYINELIGKATEDGKWDGAELLALDAKGIEVDGQKIKGILADVGETAEATSKKMHFVGQDGDLALAESEIFAMVEEMAKIQDALNFSTDIEVNKASIEALNTALSESASAMGLTSESIQSLKSKYKDLEGYDPATLFEATANGVKVNREEVAKLEKQYQDLNKSETKEHLETLVGEYNRLTAEIDKSSNAAKRAELLSKREEYYDKIQELAQYQAQLEGVTGAYQRWINAQSVSEDYEGYGAVAQGRKTVEDELKRGFLGNASKEYIDLLSGEDLVGKSVDDYIAAWEKLDNKVGSTSYSINDFFTLDDDGNITSEGIENFFDGIQNDFEGSVAKFNEKSGEWEYDFSHENLQKIQNEWGMGIEAIGLLLEAAAAAGYDVDWDGILSDIDLDTSEFETLVEYAEAAQTAFNELEGLDDVDFNFKTTNIEDAKSELEKAKSIYEDLITNDDGSINLDAPGAEQMRVMLAALTKQKQQLERPAIMDIKVPFKEAESDVGKATTAVQDLQNSLWALEQSVYDPEINSDKVKGKISEIIGSLNTLEQSDPEIYAKLGLDSSQVESLKSAISNIQANIKAGIEPSQEDIATVQSTIQGMDATVITNYLSGEQEPPENKESFVNYLLGEQAPPKDKNAKVNYTLGEQAPPLSMTATVNYVGGGVVNGTANVNGTAFSSGTIGNSGRAFKRGDWGTKDSGTALGGELGVETVVRDGHFFTIGNNGAEFFQYKKGDIIFNHKQTEELFKNGKVTSGGGRGKALATGTAFAYGAKATGRSKKLGNLTAYTDTGTGNVQKAKESVSSWGASVSGNSIKPPKKNKPSSDSGGNDGGGGGSGGGSGENEVFDWIEKLLERFDRAIDMLDKAANNIYKSFDKRNTSLSDEISKVTEQISNQQKAYEMYMAEAEHVGKDGSFDLTEEWKEKIRNGDFHVDVLNDEKLIEYMGYYQEWYEKALEAEEALQELKETLSSLYALKVENIATQYEGILGVIEHERNILEEYINQSEAQSWLVSAKYYDALAKNERETITELENQKAEMLAAFNEAMDSGTIDEGSESW